ncbi:T9SS type A sorting domain-containing protein [Winogradskyella poriferorum]|uniref:T9SS type A sorting domain-containing protein n=1 Tax=Winogradskyella poriferorum TaxID=307627 RepID=UPI003D64F697
MKIRLLFFLSLFPTFFINAQIGFEENVIVGDNPYNVQSTYVEDIDGDGDLDIISNNDNIIGWYENLGNSNFTSLREISTEVYNLSTDTYHPTFVYASDMDGDGDMDVLSASSGGNSKIAWYENLDGQGSFGSQNIITTSVIGASSVFSIDIDGDGDMDVLSASWWDDKIAWYENLDGLGTFGPQIIISNNADYANSVYAKDLDGDGDIDVLSASTSDNKLAWYENTDGFGSFGPEQIIVSNFSKAYSVHSEDLDGDGDMDVLGSSRYVGVKWYENLDGNGSFGSGQNIASSAFSFSVNTSDIDNDGDMDVVYSNRDWATGWCENTDGQGTFVNHLITNAGSGNSNAIAKDIDDDGYLDLITSDIDNDEIRWYKSLDGQGNFGEGRIMPLTVDGPQAIHCSDLDGDGDKDLLSISSGDKKIAWFENNEGNFNLQRTIVTNASENNYIGVNNSIYSGDIDGDGDEDVLFSTVNKIVWYENIDGQGNFGLSQNISVLGGYSIYIEDLDNDGDLDILSGASSSVDWYENTDGQGTFGTQQIISNEVDYAFSVYPEDIDGDGDMDVLSASRNDNKIAWYENTDGQGTFGPQQIISNEVDYAFSVYSEDIDGDGDMDVLSASRNDNKIAWYENTDGQGTFGVQQIISISAIGATSINVNDVDNDGDMDVISASISDDKIAWYENLDGYGNFGSEQILSVSADAAIWVKSADIDNDGDIDVFSASFSDDKIRLYKNLGLLGNEINGSISFDIFSNGCNSNDDLAIDVLVSSTNGNNNFASFSQTNGNYQIAVNEGDFTTQIQNLPNYYTSNPISQISNFVGIGNTDTVDFCIEPIGTINDLNIATYTSLNDPRPGFDTTYQLVYKNIGTTQLSGSVSFEFDDAKLQFLNASETVTSQTANTLNFDFTDLNPFETRTIDLEFNVFAPPTTNIDDVLLSTATITPISGDETQEDNVFELEQTVVGSYDPNDITVLEGDEIFIEDADKYLHYLIRFQNTGTASAINVNVEHVLDDNLDWTTMQLESLSHTGRVKIENQTDVSFIFNNINLPDSTNDEPNSHGFIAFKIKPKSNVQVGDIISGVADIYFDFNPPIITNTVNTEVVESLSIDEVSAEIVKLYPNPAKNMIQMTSNQVIESLMVIDINGRVLQILEILTTDYSLDISNLSKGVYFLELQSGESKSTKKFIKN